jgi:Domain of unknown function (DUF397)
MDSACPTKGGSVADSERADIAWRKSTASGNNGDCVEIAFTPGTVFVRNSQDPLGPRLSFTHSEWAAFLTGARHGEFDVPDTDLPGDVFLLALSRPSALDVP